MSLKRIILPLILIGVAIALIFGLYSVANARLKVESTPDPTTVVKSYYEALNSNDLETAMSFIADNAVMSYPDGKFQGKEMIQRVVQGWLAGNFRSENSNYRESNGEVRYDYKVYFGDNLVDQDTDGLTIVKDGKIVFDGLEKDKPQ